MTNVWTVDIFKRISCRDTLVYLWVKKYIYKNENYLRYGNNAIYHNFLITIDKRNNNLKSRPDTFSVKN